VHSPRSSPHISEFHVDVHPERERVRVEPIGELDLGTAPGLRHQLQELRASGFDAIVLDLRRITFLDSTGIALILAEDRVARERGHEFLLISGPPAVQRVLGMCGLLDELRFAGSEPAQLASPAQPETVSQTSSEASVT